MGNIVTTTFHGATLYGFERADGIFVALKPIVAAIGQLIKAVDDAVEAFVHVHAKLSQGNTLVARQVRRRAGKAETSDEIPRFGKLVAKIDQGRRQCC